MSDDNLLPLELLLDDAGHLTEEAITVLGDGEEALLPASVRAHAEACEACGVRIADAAMLSVDLGAALRGAFKPGVALAGAPLTDGPLAEAARLQTAQRGPVAARAAEAMPRAGLASRRREARFPVLAVAAGLAIAGLGAVPYLGESSARVANAVGAVVRAAPVLAKSGYALTRSPRVEVGPVAVLLPVASAMVLCLFALFLARRLSQRMMTDSGLPLGDGAGPRSGHQDGSRRGNAPEGGRGVER